MVMSLFHTHTGRQLVLETLFALTSNTKIVREAMTKGKPVHVSFTTYFVVVLSCKTEKKH